MQIIYYKKHMQDSCQLPSEHQQTNNNLEKYRKVKVLGEGSMGRAYLVQSNQDQQLYVMKRINIGHLNEKQKENALRQSQFHSFFNHPNVVQFKQLYQTTGDKLCLIMQYAQGGDLDEFIKNQSGKLLQQPIILSFFVQICLGLQEVHSKKIIHRDLKTANIFLTKDRQVKIGDFGISKTLDKTQLAATSMIGTPYYLSPEMVQGKPYSFKADIWALGIILYQLCSYKLPFEANSLPVLALKILKGSFPAIPNQYSKDLKTLLLQLLQTNQKKRPSIQSILSKPFLNKYLPVQQKQKLIAKGEQKLLLKKQKEKRQEQSVKEEKSDAKELKQKLKKEKQQKREEERRKMRQDLKKKRLQNQKQYQSIKSVNMSLKVPQSSHQIKKSPKKDVASTPKIQTSFKTKKQEIIKPWKNKDIKSNKDISIEMFVPEHRSRQINKHEIIPPAKDFKVQIFVSKRPQQIDSNEEYNRQIGRKSMPVIHEKIENYHYKTGLQSQEQYFDEEFQEQQSIQQQQQLDQIMKNMRLITQKLPNPKKQICLYEESENFDSTIQIENQHKPQQHQNLATLLSTENLQELRYILQQNLGQNRFREAYRLVKEHLDNYYELLKENDQNREMLKQRYMFNRDLLRNKLNFLANHEFESNIELIFTLIIYQEMQTHKNMEEPQQHMTNSKYQQIL